jgi:hypothetical protein
MSKEQMRDFTRKVPNKKRRKSPLATPDARAAGGAAVARCTAGAVYKSPVWDLL